MKRHASVVPNMQNQFFVKVTLQESHFKSFYKASVRNKDRVEISTSRGTVALSSTSIRNTWTITHDSLSHFTQNHWETVSLKICTNRRKWHIFICGTLWQISISYRRKKERIMALSTCLVKKKCPYSHDHHKLSKQPHIHPVKAKRGLHD